MAVSIVSPNITADLLVESSPRLDSTQVCNMMTLGKRGEAGRVAKLRTYATKTQGGSLINLAQGMLKGHNVR